MRWILSCLAVAAFAACGNDDSNTFDSGTNDATSDAQPAYANVTVEPPDVTLTVPIAGSVKQDYKAFADFGGQTHVEVTAQCAFSVADASLGSMQAATFSSAPRGGDTSITATCSGTKGTTALHLILKGWILANGTPQNAPTLFQGATLATDPSKTPSIEYPLDKAVAPLNIPSVDSQWTVAQNDLFHLTWTSKHMAIELYTLAADAQFDDPTWLNVAASASGDAVTIDVEGLLQSAPATKYASAPVTLTMSKDTIDNTAIYWWASSQGNLITQTFGQTGAPSVVKSNCTSCHSVARSGSRIGYSRCVGGDCGQIYTGFMKYDATNKVWNDTVNADNKALSGSYTTFSPVGYPFVDDKQSVALVATSACHLTMVDPDTGAAVPSNVDVVSTHQNGNPGRCGTMPDWAPDGKSVVFASTPNAGQWIDVSNSAIAMMSYSYANSTHTFGEPTMIVPGPLTLASGTYDNFFFPSFTPDGSYVVFDAARAAWRNFTVAASPGERLVMTNPTGAWTTELVNLNGNTDLDITWPHWAPTNSTDYYWVVFSTERDYGHKLTKANTAPACVANGVQQCKQIWISAISKSTLAAKSPPDDPSFAPMWMPGQDIGADNISPYWTLPTSAVVP